MLQSEKSFTLIELLIVIGILAVLAVVVVIVLNPVEFFKQARDSTRLSELQTLNKALLAYQADGGVSFGQANKVYVSIPSFYSDCSNLGLPSLPDGWSYHCANSDNYRKIDSSGWIPANFTSISFGSTLEKLPIDPVNTTSTGNYYTYVVGGSWKLTSSFESEKYAKKMNTDGGTDPALFETGSNLSLLNTGRGLVGYWKFDEGSGISANDSSGNDNIGILTGSPTWTTGKVGGALNFDVVDDYVTVIDSSSLGFTQGFTAEAWIRPDTCTPAGSGHNTVIGKESEFLFAFQTSCKMANYIYAGGSWTYDSSANIYNVPIGTLSHYAMTYDGNKIKTYLNGELKGSGTSKSGNMGNTANLLGIGKRPYSGSQYYDGFIDDVRIYNRALSAAEIAAIYNATK